MSVDSPDQHVAFLQFGTVSRIGLSILVPLQLSPNQLSFATRTLIFSTTENHSASPKTNPYASNCRESNPDFSDCIGSVVPMRSSVCHSSIRWTLQYPGDQGYIRCENHLWCLSKIYRFYRVATAESVAAQLMRNNQSTNPPTSASPIVRLPPAHSPRRFQHPPPGWVVGLTEFV